MCETKSVLVSLFSLVLAGFCLDQDHTERKVGHHSKIKSRSPCEKDCKDFCFKGVCYCLVDEDNVGCKCSWWYGGKR